MAQLAIHGLRKFYGKVEALKGIDLDIPEGEFCVFVGPSGCGKSTLLRTIAGLEDISSGTIEIDDREVNDLRPRDRNIAMVFQNYALYPYLNVFENIAFGLRSRKTPEAEIQKRVSAAAEMLGIEAMLDRMPRQLSGGQRQRVAIGRAVVRDARLFLFDEPLSNLDAQLRDGMRAEIKRLHQEIKKTMVYVTHDQIEAMTLADRIVLMRDGIIEQQGKPLELFERPVNKFVAGFLGSPQMNFVTTRLVESGNGLVLKFNHGRSLQVEKSREASLKNWIDKEVILGLRPEHITRYVTADKNSHIGEKIAVTVDLVEPTGTRTYVQFKLNDEEITAELPSHMVDKPGTEIDVLVDMGRILLFDPKTELVIA